MAMAVASFPSSSAAVAVDKATSDLLIGPDWTMNIDICDSVNSNRWQAKDVVKAVKKRLQNRNPRVQLLALTLLETMVKNCRDFVHFQIAEKNILGEMVKIVKKKTDMHVRDKILVLLDSWQEAFGGPGGKYPQYYWAYEELRRSGVTFPQRSQDAALIFTPPMTHPALRHPQAGYGMPSNSSRRLDETMATEIEGLSMSSLDSMRNVMELLSDMLQAVKPGDHEAVKDEIIVDLVNRCRSNQKLLMQMLTTTGDEELLGRGLELNDILHNLLAKHDALASGSPMPTQVASLSAETTEESSNTKPTEVKDTSSKPSSPNVASGLTRSLIDEEDEEEDDFAQLARRHSKTQSSLSRSTSGTSGTPMSADPSLPSASNPVECNALALPDPPKPVLTTKEQDMIDLLSITLSTMSTSPHPETPPAPPSVEKHQTPVSSGTQGYPYVSQTYPETQGRPPYNNYVVPWAQPQQQHQLHTPAQHQFQTRPEQHLQPPSHNQLQPPRMQTQSQAAPQPRPQIQPQQQLQPQYQLQPQSQTGRPSQPQYPYYSSAYPPPPWAVTPGYANGQNHTYTNDVSSGIIVNGTASYSPIQTDMPMRHNSSFHSRGSYGSTLNGDPMMTSVPKIPGPPGSQKPFVPSYRLFEDLNVLGNADARFKMTSSSSPTLSGSSGQGMVGGRK